jgi:hypothetical protein
MIQGQTVIVLSLDNYNKNYSEQVPFKAKLVRIDADDYICIVQSLVTSKEYEIYNTQILESLPINEISNMINLDEYGNN